MNSKNNTLRQKENVSGLTKNLITLIEEAGLSLPKLAKLAKMPVSTLNDIIYLHSNPKLDNLLNLARVFNITVSQLIDELPLKFSNIIVPILNWHNIDINFGKVNFELNKNTSYIPYSPTPPHLTSNSRLFALPVDSKISPRYTRNSIIIIEETSNFENSDLILLSINKAQPVIKKIIEDNNELFLKSIANDVSIESFNNNTTKIFGIIRETRIST
ncbi:MAG: XRE family transcriptional regulator [Rickettsia endosymbiont of Oxypoda opaca]|nr:XRE family transcriptional regulator [Rickettsia endosymbiont of Oxypoda opaca]